MILRFLFIMFVTMGLDGCGGGAMSPTTDDTSLYFNSATLTVDKAGVRVASPAGVVDLGNPEWMGNSAATSGPNLSYIMERQEDYLVVAGVNDSIGFHGVAGYFSQGFGNQPIIFDANIQIVSGKTMIQHPIKLTVNTNWDVPRVLGGVPDLGIDVFADLDISGEFSGQVWLRQNTAKLQGGVFSRDPMLHAEFIAGGFSGEQFYGVFMGQKTDQP